MIMKLRQKLLAGKRTSQNMIKPSEFICSFDNQNIIRLFYNADDALIPPSVATDGTRIFFCNISADRTGTNTFL